MSKHKNEKAENINSVKVELPIPSATLGLKTMSDDDVSEYIKTLAREGTKFECRVEGIVAAQLRNTAQRRLGIEQRLDKLRQELDALASESIRVQGEVDAHTRLLVLAEDDRRSTKGDE